MHPKLAESVSLLVYSTTSTISMATSSLETKVSGFCLVDLELEGRLYHNLHLSVLPGLCADLMLGLDFQSVVRIRITSIHKAFIDKEVTHRDKN